MRRKIEHQTFDMERALYNLRDAEVSYCVFAGPQDGESALKEARNVNITDCTFSLRYPLWHAEMFSLSTSQMDEGARAPIWYAENGKIRDTVIDGIKCLRECENIQMTGCKVKSPEFGWRCRNLQITDCSVESEYCLFESRNLKIEGLHMTGKYSFQYVENMTLRSSELDTKDAFWHSKNVTVENCVIKGEYLGWYSEGLTLIHCRIIGTQPLCYCRNLKLVDCTMEGTDLAFEYSEVEAVIKGHIESVKNPKSGKITADSVGEIIRDDSIMESEAIVITAG